MSNVSLIVPSTTLESITSPKILTTSIVVMSEVFEVTVKIPLDGFGETFIPLSKLSLIFILSGLNEITKQDTTSTIQGFLLILLSLSTFRRVRTVRDPTYRNWYNSINEDLDNIRGKISDEEVLATCPSCSTLLAVIPSKLSIDDKCPNCNANLVN